MGRHQRYNAPWRTHLGQEAQIFFYATKQTLFTSPATARHLQELAQSPPDMAVLSPFLDKFIGVSDFLRHLKQHPHITGSSGDQCDDVCGHCSGGHALGRRDSSGVGFVGYFLYCSGCLDLYYVMHFVVMN